LSETGAHETQALRLPHPQHDATPTGAGLVHQPSLACVRERATVGKPTFAQVTVGKSARSL
jgi:hypothetical protein